MIRAIAKLTAPLQRRIMLMVGRAVVNLVNDSLALQGVQVSLLADEVRDNVERFQNYGLTSHPHPGAEGIVVCVGGSRDHAVVIACDDRRYRLVGLEQGEVALYDDLGQSVVLTREGLVMRAAEGKDINAYTVNFRVHGNIIATGDITAVGNVSDANGAKSMSGMRTKYNSHKHGGSAAPTAPEQM